MTVEISRRVTLMWIAATSSSLGVCEAETITPPPAPGAAPQAAPWDELALTPIQAPGYGQDPSLLKPMVPWPLTLSEQQRESLRIAADMMLPADAHSPSAGSLYIDAFVDEWISAPYPIQQRDRRLVLSGLTWLDAEMSRRFGLAFAQAGDAQRRQVFDAIAFKKNVQPGYERPAQFFARLRGLMLSAYYSLPEGVADLGYLGNTPVLGDYPGPTAEAMAHLNASLIGLGLKPVNSG